MEVKFEMTLSHQEISVLGGKAAGKLSHQQSMDRYLENPNYCKECGKPILPNPGQKKAVAEARRKVFCNSSCAAAYNNRKVPKRKAVTQGLCQRCDSIIHHTRLRNGGYTRKRFCDQCLSLIRSEAAGRGTERKIENHLCNSKIGDYTKDELRGMSLYYNYFGSRVGSHARKIYERSGKPKVCAACGYSYHVDICHIKDISKFEGTALIREINDLSNLVALCKNHHEEFDDGFLKLDKVV